MPQANLPGSSGGVKLRRQSAPPAYDTSEMWLDTDTGVLHVPDSGDWRPVPPAQVLDEAVAFDGSDGESVTNNKTTVSAGSIALKSQSQDTASRPDDDGSGSYNEARGIQINPNVTINEIEVTFSSNLSGAGRVFVSDMNGNVIVEKTGGPYSGGGTETFAGLSLSSGTDYMIGLYDDGSDYTWGSYTSPSFPYTSSTVDITSGASGGYGSSVSAGGGSPYNILSVKGTRTAKTSGDALISWPYPDDPQAWDLASFQRTLDSETVTIDVEDGAGNVLFSDIGRNFDLSTIDSAKNVQFRVHLSRADTANNPTVDYLARRFVR